MKKKAKMTKEEIAQDATVRGESRSEMKANFPGVELLTHDGRGGNGVVVFIEAGNPELFFRVKHFGHFEQLDARLNFGQEECLKLIVALAARYNHLVKQQNEKAVTVALEPIAEITLHRDK